MLLNIHRWSDESPEAQTALLQRPPASQDVAIRSKAKAIVASVRAHGDQSLRDLTRQHDGASIENFKVSENAISAAQDQLTDKQIAAIDLAIANVRKFHQQQQPLAYSVETMPGVVCERVSHPIDAVGLYVPAGTAPLPSAAVMLAVPATIAACPRIILCTPPRSDGTADPAVLVAAERAGVAEIYTLGGAQAIAAMAYGTESVPKVNKVFGPGNAWVTAAKSIVSSDPAGAAIDMPAGPSEVLVISDAGSSIEFVAADLLSQAEHGIDSQVILITTDEEQAANINAELLRQLESLSRSDIATTALQNARLLIVDDLETAISISNQYAPEHLILQCANARQLLPQIRNAGSVFVGQWTPESVGDYCSGTNHVLPTYGFAATYSGLGVDQFVRQMTIQEVSRDGLARLAPAVISLAELEGLDAHAAAVSRRMEAMA